MADRSKQETAQICKRCKVQPSVLVVRTDPLCEECFTKFIRTKVIKRMETFRVRNSTEGQQRKLLLPISFGVSSVTLLHILDHHLKGQKQRSGRTGFELYLVYVEPPSKSTECPSVEQIESLRGRFSDYDFSIEHLPDEVPEDIRGDTNPDHGNATNANGDSTLFKQSLQEFLQSLPSATARSDVLFLLRNRIVVETAQKKGCEGILWGDSTTKLAEKTISETAKGRGYSIPWHVSEGASPFSATFHYPARDILKKELVAYSGIMQTPLTDIIVQHQRPKQSPTITKNTTIDDLMRQYFDLVEENYPSIVANVVRTTGRLDVPTHSTDAARCDLCQTPVLDQRFGIYGWGGDQGDSAHTAEESPSKKLCYGCSRSMP